MRRPAYLVLALALASCSKGSGPPLDISGSIAVDGAERTATACALSGSKLDQTLSLTLDDGAVVKVPIHGGAPSLDSTKLECESNKMSGSGSGQSFDGALELECGRLSMKVTLRCGEPGPSNRKDENKKKK